MENKTIVISGVAASEMEKAQTSCVSNPCVLHSWGRGDYMRQYKDCLESYKYDF